MNDNFDLDYLSTSCNFDSTDFNKNFFTHFPFVLASALVAGIGLKTNKPRVIMASLLFSPIGIQIIRSVFGIVNGNSTQVILGILNHLLYVVCVFLIGYYIGNIIEESDINDRLITITSWYDKHFITTALLAIISGVVLAIASHNKDTLLMVGIRICTPILLPIIASGIFTSLQTKTKNPKYENMARKSLSLWLFTYVTITIIMLLTFKFICK